MFLLISTHFTDTPGIPLSSHGLKFHSFKGRPVVEPLDSPLTYETAYAPFTPSDSEQRLLPPCYRGCWHGVSRSFLWSYRQAERVLTNPVFVPPDRVYDPKTFLTHAASLHQGFPHCGSLSTAASRRSLGRISVPVWPDTLSGRLPIGAMVSRYLTI